MAGMNWPGIAPPTTSSTNSKPAPRSSGSTAQVDLAELPGAARLLLVAVMALGRPRDRLAIRHARRAGLDRDAVAIGHPLQHHAQVQVAEAVEHGLVLRGVVLDAHARVLGDEAVQRLGELLLVAALLGADRQPEHRRRERDRLQVVVVLVVRVVQHGVEVQLVDLRHGADVAGNRLRDLGVLLALQLVEVRDLDRLARVADEQLRAGLQRALVHAEDAHLADERVDRDLEHVREHVLRGVRRHLDPHRVGALALEERRRVALGGIRHQPREDLDQLGNARARLGGAEADRHEMILAQRLLERVVQLLRRDLLALLEVERHQLLVDLDHLVDDLGVRRLDGREIRRLAARLVEAVDDRLAAVGRQVERQAGLAEGLADVGQHLLGARLAAVDLVDDDQPAQAARLREFHHALGHRLDAVHRAHHDHRGLDRLEGAEAAAEEVGIPRGVDDVDPPPLGLEAADRRVERVEQVFLLGIEVADRRAAGQRPLGPDGPGLREQGFGQQRLARAGLAHQGDVADVRRRIGH